MHDDLPDLPEALPLRRVSPGWRIIALLELLLLVVLVLALFVSGAALLQHRSRFATAQATPAMVMPAPPATLAVAPAVGEEADPQTLPYPVHEDLRQAVGAASDTLRTTFLGKGSQEVWRAPLGHLPEHVRVSPDGQKLAYFVGTNLAAGEISNVIEVGTGDQAGVTGAGGMSAFPAAPPGFVGPRRLRGLPAWGSDSRSLWVAEGNGQMRRYGAALDHVENLPFQGECPAPVPGESAPFVFVRTRPTVKLDRPGTLPTPDRSEVVLGDPLTRRVRILVPASPSTWTQACVSPDGKRLALVSDRGFEERRLRRFRVFVMDLAEGSEPRPLTPPADRVESVCWTPDGTSLVYARSQEPPPPDISHGNATRQHATLDLFEWDLAAGKETRLSRGGGFTSPTVAEDESLFFLTWEPQGITRPVRLLRLPLAAARAFAREAPYAQPLSAAAWAKLAEQSLQAAPVDVDATGERLTPEALARVAETFLQLYRQEAGAAPPTAPQQLDQLCQGLDALGLPPQTRTQLALVLGAVAGEHLRRQHGAAWHLGKGPLFPSPGGAASPPAESPFGLVVNPFVIAAERTAGPRGAGSAGAAPQRLTFTAITERAEGRPLVLTNDPDPPALAALTDPDLARGEALLQEGKGDEAERVLLTMLQQRRHGRNDSLALRVAQLLYEQQRLPALRQLLDRLCQQKPHTARKFHLLGLAHLRGAGRAEEVGASLPTAVEAFKNALRCDLRYEPAWLNLALAYEQLGDAHSARQCLNRYLETMPDGVYTLDAQRRLGSGVEPGAP